MSNLKSILLIVVLIIHLSLQDDIKPNGLLKVLTQRPANRHKALFVKPLNRMNRVKREDFSFLKEIPETMIQEKDISDYYNNKYKGDQFEYVTDYINTETDVYEIIEENDEFLYTIETTRVTIPPKIRDTSCRYDRDCDVNAHCLNYFCFCDENFFGSGKKCCPSDKMCFGYGDPHYITFDNLRFDITTDCTYILASDSCYGAETYKILVEHEIRFNTTYFIKQLHVILDDNNTYVIATSVTLNKRPLALPFVSSDKRVRFYKDGIFSVMETDEFLLKFDGNKYLKFSECGNRVCGLCGRKDGRQVNPRDFLVKDKPQCQ